MIREAAVTDRVERRRTRIKILNDAAMRCDAAGCQAKAAYLFRVEEGPIAAFCAVHAGHSASEAGIKLPTSKIAMLRTMPAAEMAARRAS